MEEKKRRRWLAGFLAVIMTITGVGIPLPFPSEASDVWPQKSTAPYYCLDGGKGWKKVDRYDMYKFDTMPSPLTETQAKRLFWAYPDNWSALKDAAKKFDPGLYAEIASTTSSANIVKYVKDDAGTKFAWVADNPEIEDRAIAVMEQASSVGLAAGKEAPDAIRGATSEDTAVPFQVLPFSDGPGALDTEFLAAVGLLFNNRILNLVNVPEDIFSDAALYLAIYFLGLPFLFMYNVQASIFNALGDSKKPLYLLIFSSLLNIVLDMILVIIFKQGVRGVALATLIAQGISAVISFLLLMRKLKGYPAEEPVRLYSGEMAVSMVKIAVPSTLQQSIVHIGILLVQSVINSFGSTAIAGYSAGMRIESLSIVPMLSMGNAMSTFTAQNMGAGKIDRVKEGYRMCYVIVLTAGAVLCVMYQLAGGAFVSLFLDSGSSEAYSVGLSYVKFLSFFYSFIGLKASTDGLLRGAGDVTAFTVANLVNLAIRVSVTNLFAPIYGIQVAWMAVPLGWAANYVISFGWYLTGKWKKVRVIKK